jgi:hypothetical protein
MDLSTYDKLSGVHRPNIITYLNKLEGIRIETFQDEVMSVTYFAGASNLQLRCELNERQDDPEEPVVRRVDQGTQSRRYQ